MKILLVGIIFMIEDKDLFMGWVIGFCKIGMMVYCWDILKGCVENFDLSVLDVVWRECLEEIGFSNYNLDFLEDLGVFKYFSNKDL